jgi:thioredoxin-dependent peroxiredoxin
MTDTTRLEAGDPAPHLDLVDQDGASVSLAALAGSKVVVYFYPAALTPACTTEACDFRDSLGSLATAGYRVLGVSRDAPDTLRAFRTAEGLAFPLLSDPELVAHRAWGAWGPKNLYGKTVTGVLRSTFVVDETGKLTLALYNVRATGHVASLRKRLGLGA